MQNLRIVDFETAKKLDELGMKVETDLNYVSDDSIKLCEYKLSRSNFRYLYSAPTFEQVSRWMRDVHHICIVVQPDERSETADKDFRADAYFFDDNVEEWINLYLLSDTTGPYDLVFELIIKEILPILEELKYY